MSGMGELSGLLNVGAVLEQQLQEAGISTAAQLHALGSKQAWLKIRQIDSSACLHRLYALEGAIRGVKKSQLPPEVRAELLEFFRVQTK